MDKTIVFFFYYNIIASSAVVDVYLDPVQTLLI